MLKISHHSLLQINFIVIVPSQNLDVKMMLHLKSGLKRGKDISGSGLYKRGDYCIYKGIAIFLDNKNVDFNKNCI
jgi:hypothetical protein